MGHYEAMRSHRVDPEALQRLCHERGIMRPRQLQARCGLSRSMTKYVWKAERNLSDTSAGYIARALGVDISEFTISAGHSLGHPGVAA